jgi:hypothetical protein
VHSVKPWRLEEVLGKPQGYSGLRSELLSFPAGKPFGSKMFVYRVQPNTDELARSRECKRSWRIV